MKILLIDDDEILLEYFRELVFQEEECFTASSFEQFIESYGKRKYDLIITDYYLDCEKTAKDIINYIEGKAPVIVMTGGISSETAHNELMQLGCKQVLSKPITKNQIKKQIFSLFPQYFSKEPKN